MRLEHTPSTREALRVYQLKHGMFEHLQSENHGVEWIDHTFLIKIAAVMGPENSEFALSRLVLGSRCWFEPAKPKPKKSQEYMKLMSSLRANEAEREYQELIASPRTTVMGPIFEPGEAKEIREELTTIVNILISGVAVAAAFWFWGSSLQLATRTLLSLFGAILTLVAEVVVYLGYRRRVEEARVTERKKKEKKEIKQVLSITPDSQNNSQTASARNPGELQGPGAAEKQAASGDITHLKPEPITSSQTVPVQQVSGLSSQVSVNSGGTRRKV